MVDGCDTIGIFRCMASNEAKMPMLQFSSFSEAVEQGCTSL